MMRRFPYPHDSVTGLDGNGNWVKDKVASRRDLNADCLRRDLWGARQSEHSHYAKENVTNEAGKI